MVLGPMSWFLGPELVPQRHRSSLFCLCYGINNILITITNFSTIPLYQHIGAYTFLPLFIVPSVCALIYLYLYLPETRGRETHAIVASMRRKKLKDVESCCDFTPDLTKL
ncbi:Solute carrier family 2, facilitated glucose transporter member 10 [Toxocara canis]|uniref:Solute carrier family 2, facilitated glucose transporter member 10 n=1 Tax=Toxocara canis TaxID=6265 RepID=A0A0B2UQX2_TOXCA|nr:Solute carrier family 2, facilitated glucose transporter member 10 [Toxocara canis]